MSEEKTFGTKALNVEAKPSIDQREVPIPQVTDFDAPSLYSNSVGIVATPFDLRLTFGEIKPKGESLINEPLTSIVMSWEHAKALSHFLQKQLEEHERDFGPCSMPSSNHKRTAKRSNQRMDANTTLGHYRSRALFCDP